MDPSDPQQMNAYAYANNNPVSMSDPDGRFYYVDRDGHVRAPSAKGWTPAAKKRVKQQMAKWRPVYQRETQQQSARFKASGYTPEEYAEAKKIQQKSVFDVAIEAGGEILVEFLGINDIKNCFGEGDVGACISMVVNVIPWSKLFRLGELLGAVKKAWNAVTSFRGQQKRANKIIDAVENACSFSGDTEVLMADGTRKPISDVEPGDRVLATDPETGEQSAQTVTAVWVHEDTLVDLEVDRPDELTEGTSSGVRVTVTTTDDHSFWNHTDQQWQPAGALDPGDELLTADGSRTTAVGLLVYTEHEAPAYNLTVTDLHTYYVVAGTTPVLVHNDGPADCFRGARPGDTPSLVPRPNDYKVDPTTGFVKETHGVSVFDNSASVAGKGFVPHRIDMDSVPSSLRIIQRGRDPRHFEIVPAPGASLTPEAYSQALSQVQLR
jgi:hypothetical protein